MASSGVRRRGGASRDASADPGTSTAAAGKGEGNDATKETKKGAPLRVGFLHPDLGLGGAERLVVDAAAGLARRGHNVTMFTSHYERERSFEETRDGRYFPVVVHGDWLPRHLLQRLHILFAMLRSVWLAACVGLLYWGGSRFDVLVCDQVSVCVPVLRMLAPRSRILFYCHFPDRLLSPHTSLLRKAYRVPFDLIEEVTTGMSDHILVNSNFTKGMFMRTFTWLARYADPDVLHPCIDVDSITPTPLPPRTGASAEGAVFLSINRFERKKDIALAVHAFAKLRAHPGVSDADFKRARLVLAGGCDTRVLENVEYHAELVELVEREGLKGQVEFVLSFSDDEKVALLRRCSAVVYTPANEHFGIVPIECMAAGRPVIAVASGGPLESVADGASGLLCDPTPDEFAAAMARFVPDGTGRAAASKMGATGRSRVQDLFSRDAFSDRLDIMCRHLVVDPPTRWLSAVTLWLITLTCVCACATAVVLAAPAAYALVFGDPSAAAAALLAEHGVQHSGRLSPEVVAAALAA